MTVRDEPSTEDTALVATPYRYLCDLARGGMGEVVEAEHRALGKRVVVKLLHRDLAARADLVDRMRVEAQTLARLAHPNLVAVTDFGETVDGRPYFVMERLVGCTFREELAARGALPPAEAADYVVQALRGVAAAHAVGVIHRDLKLENLFLCEGAPRTVKVLDFGIAKVLTTAADGAPDPLAFPTQSTQAVGSPRFLSPEQARREPVDERADVYGMGLVLYALVAGRGPFDHHRSVADILVAHAVETPQPPSALAPQPLPAALDALVLRALEKDPAARFQSANELAEALAALAPSLRRAPPKGAVTASDLARTAVMGPKQEPGNPPISAEKPRFRDPFDATTAPARIHAVAMSDGPAPPGARESPLPELPIRGLAVVPPWVWLAAVAVVLATAALVAQLGG